MSAPRVFLDACVLFPPLVRTILLGTAPDRFQPLWSQRVLDEWRIAIARKSGPDAERGVLEAIVAMTEAYPDALLPPNPDREAQIHLPDPADAHVVAAASGAADIVLTFNLRDFPRRALAAHALTPRDPDGFLWELLSEDAEIIPPLQKIFRDFDLQTDTRRALKRARLPRFGKAWDAAVTSDSQNPAKG